MHVKLVPMSQKINDVASTNMDRCRLKQQTVVNSCEASVQQLDGRTNYAERISQISNIAGTSTPLLTSLEL